MTRRKLLQSAGAVVADKISTDQKSRRYYVTTWDGDKQKWTPQIGVRRGPHTIGGLRKALRKLRGMGYGTKKSDGNFVMIECLNEYVRPELSQA